MGCGDGTAVGVGGRAGDGFTFSKPECGDLKSHLPVRVGEVILQQQTTISVV